MDHDVVRRLKKPETLKSNSRNRRFYLRASTFESTEETEGIQTIILSRAWSTHDAPGTTCSNIATHVRRTPTSPCWPWRQLHIESFVTIRRRHNKQMDWQRLKQSTNVGLFLYLYKVSQSLARTIFGLLSFRVLPRACGVFNRHSRCCPPRFFQLLRASQFSVVLN